MTVAADELPTVQVPIDFPLNVPEMVGRWAAELGPIFKAVWAPGLEAVFMVGPKAHDFVLHTHREHFSHEMGWTPIFRDFCGRGLLNMDGAEHEHYRRVLQPPLGTTAVGQYLPLIDRVIRECIRTWEGQNELDLYEEARIVTFAVAAHVLLSLSDGGVIDRLRNLFKTVLNAPNVRLSHQTREQYQRQRQANEELDALLLELVQIRRSQCIHQESPVDMLGILVQAVDRVHRPLTDEQVLGHLRILMIAAHETTTLTACWTLYLLATHPEHLNHLRNELGSLFASDECISSQDLKRLSLLNRTVIEAGRLASPLGNLPRGVVRDFEFEGYRVPAGSRVLCSVVASHNLPDIFDHPRLFDPDRLAPPRAEDRQQPHTIATFGSGPRTCLGMNFAHTELRLLVARVFSRYELEPSDETDHRIGYYSVVAGALRPHGPRVRPRRLGQAA